MTYKGSSFNGTVVHTPIAESCVDKSIHKVINVQYLNESTFVLSIERKNVEFKAGQHFSITPPYLGVNREYSIFSGENDERLEFLIKRVEGGVLSNQLGKLKKGDVVELSGPFGEFCLDLDLASPDQRDFLFIATGTGIAPFRSFVRTFPDIKYQLVHGVRYSREDYSRHYFDPNRVVLCVSREKTPYTKGWVTTYLLNSEIKQPISCYLCGNGHMISDSYELLRNIGVSGDQIFMEAFF
jgi:ferredoxin-NADP reductase